jgi:hypothetical protein
LERLELKALEFVQKLLFFIASDEFGLIHPTIRWSDRL